VGKNIESCFFKFTDSFSHDDVNRLAGANSQDPNHNVLRSQNWSYDQYGNMWMTNNTGVPGSGLTPTSNIFNGSNQMSGMSYDAAGNKTVFGADTLPYDAENHLTQVTQSPSAGGGQMNYTYDGSGQRIGKTVVGGPSTVYVYDAFGHLAAEYASAASPTAPLCQTCYLSTDYLGSTRLVTDQSGNVVGRHDYLPFGAEIPAGYASRHSEWDADDLVNQKFTGQERDQETGLDFFKARYYAGVLGRFQSPDPFNAGGNPLNPQSWNGYAYVNNNPLAFVDPNGMTCVNDTGGTVDQGDGAATGDNGDGKGCAALSIPPSNSTFSVTKTTDTCKWWEFWCSQGGGSPEVDDSISTYQLVAGTQPGGESGSNPPKNEPTITAAPPTPWY
jgi:RHS repeat-associated protein